MSNELQETRRASLAANSPGPHGSRFFDDLSQFASRQPHQTAGFHPAAHFIRIDASVVRELVSSGRQALVRCEEQGMHHVTNVALAKEQWKSQLLRCGMGS